MADKYMNQQSGGFGEAEFITSSAGAGDAGKGIAAGSDGKIDPSFMPPGVTPEVLTLVATEDLSAGNLVNVYDDTGTAKCRKADASNGRIAHGFVNASVTSGNNATVFTEGVVSGLTSLTAGLKRFLGTTAGGTQATAPTGSGQIAQEVGFAKSATELVFSAQIAVTRA